MYNICKTPPPERTNDQESLDLKVLPTLVYDQSCIHVVSTNMAQAWERIADGMERGQGEAETLSPTEEEGGGECRDCVLSKRGPGTRVNGWMWIYLSVWICFAACMFIICPDKLHWVTLHFSTEAHLIASQFSKRSLQEPPRPPPPPPPPHHWVNGNVLCKFIVELHGCRSLHLCFVCTLLAVLKAGEVICMPLVWTVLQDARSAIRILGALPPCRLVCSLSMSGRMTN